MLELADVLRFMSLVDEEPIYAMSEIEDQAAFVVKIDPDKALVYESPMFQLHAQTTVMCYPEAAILLFLVVIPVQGKVHILAENTLNTEDPDDLEVLDKLRQQSVLDIRFYDLSLNHLFTRQVHLDMATRAAITQHLMYAMAYNESCESFSFEAAYERLANGEEPTERRGELAVPEIKTPFTDKPPKYIVDIGWKRDVPQERDWRGNVRTGARLWLRMIDEDRRPARSKGRLYVAFYHHDIGFLRGNVKKRVFWTFFDVEEDAFRQSPRNPDFWGIIYHLDQPKIPVGKLVYVEAEFRLQNGQKLFATSEA